MQQLQHVLFITYSNQKARDLQKSRILQTFDIVIPFSQLILDTYEKQHFETVMDDVLGASIIDHIIQEEKVGYFDPQLSSK